MTDIFHWIGNVVYGVYWIGGFSWLSPRVRRRPRLVDVEQIILFA